MSSRQTPAAVPAVKSRVFLSLAETVGIKSTPTSSLLASSRIKLSEHLSALNKVYEALRKYYEALEILDRCRVDAFGCVAEVYGRGTNPLAALFGKDEALWKAIESGYDASVNGEGSGNNLAYNHRTLFKVYKDSLLNYLDELIKTLNGLEHYYTTCSALRREYEHYRLKCEKLSLKLKEKNSNGSDDKMARNEKKLEQARAIYLSTEAKVTSSIDHIIDRSWHDLHPLFLRLVQFEISYPKLGTSIACSCLSTVEKQIRELGDEYSVRKSEQRQDANGCSFFYFGRIQNILQDLNETISSTPDVEPGNPPPSASSRLSFDSTTPSAQDDKSAKVVKSKKWSIFTKNNNNDSTVDNAKVGNANADNANADKTNNEDTSDLVFDVTFDNDESGSSFTDVGANDPRDKRTISDPRQPTRPPPTAPPPKPPPLVSAASSDVSNSFGVSGASFDTTFTASADSNTWSDFSDFDTTTPASAQPRAPNAVTSESTPKFTSNQEWDAFPTANTTSASTATVIDNSWGFTERDVSKVEQNINSNKDSLNNDNWAGFDTPMTLNSGVYIKPNVTPHILPQPSAAFPKPASTTDNNTYVNTNDAWGGFETQPENATAPEVGGDVWDAFDAIPVTQSQSSQSQPSLSTMGAFVAEAAASQPADSNPFASVGGQFSELPPQSVAASDEYNPFDV